MKDEPDEYGLVSNTPGELKRTQSLGFDWEQKSCLGVSGEIQGSKKQIY
jgi:hypothetical protein